MDRKRRTQAMAARAAALALIGLPMAASSAATGSPAIPGPVRPPMGWSSWNSFSNTISSAVTQQQADALVSTGLRRAGYQYVNIDEGWWLGTRDTAGNIVVDPKQWPALAPGERAGDMANIVRYIHAKGLKAGIYTDVGLDGCSMYPDVGPAYRNVGSRSHYEQDFVQFARWGFDYVKVDWCGGDKENLSGQVQYAEVARAIDRAARLTGRRLVLSICNWGKQSPWTWGPGVGGIDYTLWRTGGDIIPPIVTGSANEGRRITVDKILKSFDDAIHPEAQHTGYFNDADMMVVGMPGTTGQTDRLHMALWAMAGGPLLVGADLTKLDGAMVATLANEHAIAVDQDSLGLQAVKVGEVSPGLEIWSKRLDGMGRRAVLLLNRTYFPAPFRVAPGPLALTRIAAAKDVWGGAAPRRDGAGLSATVPAQDALFLLVEGDDAPATTLSRAAPDAADAGTTRSVFTGDARTDRPITALRVTYRNAGSTAHAALFVNGETGTAVALPPVAGKGQVWLQAKLAKPGQPNQVAFEPAPGQAVDIVQVDAF